MKNCVLFCITLLSLKLLVKGKYEKPSANYSKAVSLDLCEIAKEGGSCNKSIIRYYYDLERKECATFFYRGCGGNPNNFKSREECEKSCPGKFIQTRKPLPCFHEPDKGPCKAKQQSFYYDRKTNNCKKFIYGGCGGNSNRFSTSVKCHRDCRTYEFSLQLKPYI